MEEKKRTDRPLHKEVRQLRYENALLKRQVKDLKQNLSICINTNISFLEVVTEHLDDFSKEEKEKLAVACVNSLSVYVYKE